MLPPTAQIKTEWWDPQDRGVLLVNSATTDILDLTPKEKNVTYEIRADKGKIH